MTIPAGFVATRTLRQRLKGKDVEVLQALLNAKVPTAQLPKGKKLGVDGDFGPNTHKAVETYQRLNGLSVDGVVGKNTWTRLGVTWTGKTKAQPQRRPSLIGTPEEMAAAPWMAIAIAESKKNTREIADNTWDDSKTKQENWKRISKAVAGKENPEIIKYWSATSSNYWASDEIPWCSAFVNWVLAQAGITGTRSGSARSWESWSNGIDIGTEELVYGAVMTIKRTGGSGRHVGFYVGGEDGSLWMLGGNQSNRVCLSKQTRSLMAQRWPVFGPVGAPLSVTSGNLA